MIRRIGGEEEMRLMRKEAGSGKCVEEIKNRWQKGKKMDKQKNEGRMCRVEMR